MDISASDLRVANTKKQTTRLLRLVCPNCGAVLRATRKFLAAGRPTCPCGYAMQVIDDNPLARGLDAPGVSVNER
jgi:predicted RNA-binding Zn-ribbon protein involved in translation (DUF1610 family)